MSYNMLYILLLNYNLHQIQEYLYQNFNSDLSNHKFFDIIMH